MSWIKFRQELATHPVVRRLARTLGITRQHACGCLAFLFWEADAHSVDGTLEHLTDEDVDDIAGLEGFAEALAEAGWLQRTDSGIQLVRYAEHNGATAKQRAENARRKELERAGMTKPRKPKAKATPAKNRDNDPETAMSHEVVTGCRGGVTKVCDKSVTREEKRREEIHAAHVSPQSPPTGGERKRDKPEPVRGFDAWWDAYPARNGRKGSKSEARREWDRRVKPDDVPRIMRATANLAASGQMPKDAERWLRPPRGGEEPPWVSWVDVVVTDDSKPDVDRKRGVYRGETVDEVTV